jgi:limonene-1,2-epoxide hydrolase
MPTLYGSVILAALLIFGVVTYNVLNATPSPTKTLNTYCTALKAQDYGTAYKQFNSATKQLFNVVEFVQYASDNAGAGAVTNCHVVSAHNTDTQGIGTIAYTYNDRSTRSINYKLASDANGDWYITNVLISTPSIVLNSYCDAVKRQDYATAYKLVSNDVRVQETEAQYATHTKRFAAAGGKGIASCIVSNIVNGGAQAAGTITYTSLQGKEATVDYVLVEESGVWKLDSEQPRLSGTNSSSSSSSAGD